MDLVYMQLPLVFFTAAAPMASGAFIGLACAFLTTRFSVDTLRRIDRWTLLPLAILAVGVVSAVVFLSLIHILRALKTPTFAYSAVIVTVVNSALAVGSVILPIYLQNVLGLTAFETGILMTPGAVATIFLSPISGMLFDKFGPRVIAIVGQMCIRDRHQPSANVADTRSSAGAGEPG